MSVDAALCAVVGRVCGEVVVVVVVGVFDGSGDDGEEVECEEGEEGGEGAEGGELFDGELRPVVAEVAHDCY